jgi:regulator of sigma E protease
VFIVYAVIIFAILIFVHELGHFIAARVSGISVREFALGMGPKLFKKQGKQTLFSIRAFPIGGFCALEGEDEDSEDPHAFNNRPIPARALTLVAGSLMNILLAILLLSIIIFVAGEPTTKIAEISADSPALSAGLTEGDQIVSLNGETIKSWADISAYVTDFNQRAASGEVTDDAAAIEVLRADGSRETIKTAFYEDADGNMKIGITPVIGHSPGFAFRSIGYGAHATWNMTKMMFATLGDLFTGKAGIDSLTGPVGIVKTVGDTAQMGFGYVVQLAALISLNLGIVNLLPLPALDGGRILFLIVRLFTGKRVSDTVEGRIHLVGFVLLIALMIYVTVIDVNRFILN